MGANTWNWDFGDEKTDSVYNPVVHEYSDTGTYFITLLVSNEYQCYDSAAQSIIVQPEMLIYIPNAFTPNDDGINDLFMVKGELITNFEMAIYDRWGKLIYFTDDFHKPWDGKVNQGTEYVQQDVYIYSIKIIDFQSKKHFYRGTVTVIK